MLSDELMCLLLRELAMITNRWLPRLNVAGRNPPTSPWIPHDFVRAEMPRDWKTPVNTGPRTGVFRRLILGSFRKKAYPAKADPVLVTRAAIISTRSPRSRPSMSRAR